MSTARPMTGGEKLVVWLGWSPDDFEAGCKEASLWSLKEALRILEAPDHPEMSEDSAHRAKWGAGYLRELIAKKEAEDG